MNDDVDRDLLTLRGVAVHYVTQWPYPIAEVEWRRVDGGFMVTATTALGTRSATITRPDEIRFLLESGANLYLREGWHQYDHGRCGEYKGEVFITEDGWRRTPYG